MKIEINKGRTFLYIIVLLFVLWLNYWSKNFLSTMLFYTLIVLPTVSFLICRYVFKLITLKQETNQIVIKKLEDVKFKVTFFTGGEKHFNTINFYNPIEMVFNYSGQVQSGFDAHASIILQRRKDNFKIFNLLFQHSGTYEVGLKKIQVKDFTGLVTLSRQLTDFKELRIYPLIRAVESFPLPQNQNDNTEVEQFKNSDLFDGVKTYEPGDHLAAVNWKVSSKLSKLYSKQYEKIGKNRTICIVYNKKTELEVSKRIVFEEWFVEMSLGIFNYFVVDKRGFDLLYQASEKVHYSISSREDFYDMYEHYSFTKTNNQIIIQDLIDQYLDDYDYQVNLSSIIIFTSVLDAEFYNQVYELRKNDLSVEICYLKSNLYHERLNEEVDILKEIRELNISYYEIRMDEDSNEKS